MTQNNLHAPDAAWEQALSDSLPTANVPTLLMVLMHLTGDKRWLSERYQCSRIRGLDDNDSGGLDEAVQQEIRDAARAAVVQWKRGEAPVLPAPSHTDCVEMLRISIGEPVPDTYGPMVAAGLGGPAYGPLLWNV